jgi:hypothetical protein
LQIKLFSKWKESLPQKAQETQEKIGFFVLFAPLCG